MASREWLPPSHCDRRHLVNKQAGVASHTPTHAVLNDRVDPASLRFNSNPAQLGYCRMYGFDLHENLVGTRHDQ